MSLEIGTRLGPYEIVAPIGAGGMGEVYRGRDTRLDRAVAIKILPSHLSAKLPVRERFEREARAISSLSNAHICTLYDLGHENGTDFLVMEYLEGETLEHRLTRGPLPVEQVLRFGTQMADALAAAHRQGIIHRDLKPGNIMLTKSGVKLLDFGLAKYREPVESTAVGETHRATEAKPLTEEGTVIGTFQYMAPEQLEGLDADERTDIFALGAVLYEMATGRRAFEGKTKTSLIAAILDREPPPLSTLQPMAPPALERVIRTCLAKTPDDRWQSAHDVAEELRWIHDAGSQAGVLSAVVKRRRYREALAWILAAVGILAAGVIGGLYWSSRTVTPEPLKTSILPPKGVEFDFTVGPMELSPDGRRLAFVAPTASGENSLWVRKLSGDTAHPLAGTEGASYPFWSPDSRYVGFFAGGKLKKIDADGGPPQALCEALNARGGTWSRDNVILFALIRDGLYQVPAAGGSPKRITALDIPKGEADHRWPWFLPDAEHYLFQARAEDPEESSVWLGKLGSNDRNRLTQSSGRPIYANGYLLHTRERTLLAQKFDLKSLSLVGEAAPVAERLQYFPGTALAMFSLSDSGLLAYSSGGAKQQLTWYDRAGHNLGTVGQPNDYGRVEISPDDRRVVTSVGDTTRHADVWIHEVGRAAATRFTPDSASEVSAIWSPDGTKIAYSVERKAPAYDLVIKDARGTAPVRDLWAEPDSQKYPIDWSRDGRSLLVLLHNPKGKVVFDIWLFSIPEAKARPLVQSRFSDLGGSFSPDGKWFAYQSNESGRWEIYAQRIDGGSKLQISNAGGTSPRWSRNGREIFFISLKRKLVAMPIVNRETLEVGEPQPLFDAHLGFLPGTAQGFAVTSDGQRFLFRSPDEADAAEIALVINWQGLVKR